MCLHTYMVNFGQHGPKMQKISFMELRALLIGHVVSLAIGLPMALIMLPCLDIVAIDGGLCQFGGGTSFPAWFTDVYIKITVVSALTVLPLASHLILDSLILYKLISFPRTRARFTKGICTTKFLVSSVTSSKFQLIIVTTSLIFIVT